MKKANSRIISFYFIFGFLLLLSGKLAAQITVLATEIPKNTPPDDSIYISGSFNNWNAADPKYRLLKQPNGSYITTINSTLNFFEYKFTRGNWKRVEGGEKGIPIANRSFNNDSDHGIVTKIFTWEDLEMVKVIVTKIPENTPATDIYLSGDFNLWNPKDPAYKLKPTENGTYEVSIPAFLNNIAYKFTRGNLSSFESNKTGRPIQNRVINRSKLSSLLVENEIMGWEDLSGATIDFFILFLAIAVFLGFFVTITLNEIKREQKGANTSLMLLLSTISFVLLIKISMYNQSIFNLVPKLNILPDFILFAFAPVLYHHSRKLLFPAIKMEIREYFYFFAPVILQLLVYLPVLTINNELFIQKTINRDFDLFFRVLCGAALFYNCYYCYRLILLIKPSAQTMDTTSEIFRGCHTYLSTLILLLIIILFTGIITFVVSLSNLLFFTLDSDWISEKGLDLAWIGISTVPVIVSYFMIVKPEIFRKVEKYKNTKDISTTIKTQLTTLMETKKPYLNADMTLQDLAELVDTNTHTLSRIINEGHSKNFFDYVNWYRIEEFKTRVNKGYHKKQTFLAIAYDAGFSSKTTFNRTFKKITGITPRTYLNSLKDEEISMKLTSEV